MRFLTHLTTKILFIITLSGLIAGSIILYLNMKHQSEFINLIFESNSKFLNDTLKTIQENALKTEYARHREMITSLSTIFLGMHEDNQHSENKKIVLDMLDLSLNNDGMMAITILNSNDKIILTIYKENGELVHSMHPIPKFISNDTSLQSGKSNINNDKYSGVVEGYFTEQGLISGVLSSSEVFLENFDFFTEELLELEEDILKHRPIALVMFFLILTITTWIAIKVLVSSPLEKIKKGMDDFFLVLGKNKSSVNKITIDTQDEFGNMAQSLNDKISIGLELHSELDKAQKKIQDAISHSSMIQKSFMPNNKIMNEFFNDNFIHWKPRDVVGGDIYFFDKFNDDESLLMCIDCTGHSISGALITVLMKSIHFHIMQDIKKGFMKKNSPSQMLNYFNKKIKLILDQHNEYSKSDVGFDGGIVYCDKKNKLIKYSGSKTPLLYIEDGSDELNMIKYDEYSVGYKSCDINHQYEEYEIKINEKMKFYISTDGFLDQMGGEKEFRFGKSRFHEMIKLHHDKPFRKQKAFYKQELHNYQGNTEAIDDITFIGFQI